MILKNDLEITGTLTSIDQFLNIKLEEIKINDLERFPQMAALKSCFIRGSVVRYVDLLKASASVDVPLLQDACRRENSK